MIKCVIWDLDNTLFDGVFTEDSGVAVRPGFKDLLAALSRQGVISSVASRNDAISGEDMLRRTGLRDLVVYPQISWERKSESVARILSDLHFRAADVLFVDDREFERDEVRARFPEILVHDGSTAREVESLIDGAPGPAMAGERFAMYKQEEVRLKDKARFESNVDDFLAQCGIEMTLRPARREDVPRLHELFERTNQLNAAKFKISADDLDALIADPGQKVFSARVSDRYGDYGESALLICDAADAAVLRVTALVISCRLMGKGIAQALLAFAAALAEAGGQGRLVCRYLQTEYNRQMILLFTMNGLGRVEEAGDVWYALDLAARPLAVPAWIRADWSAALPAAAATGGRARAAADCVF